VIAEADSALEQAILAHLPRSDFSDAWASRYRGSAPAPGADTAASSGASQSRDGPEDEACERCLRLGPDAEPEGKQGAGRPEGRRAPAGALAIACLRALIGPDGSRWLGSMEEMAEAVRWPRRPQDLGRQIRLAATELAEAGIAVEPTGRRTGKTRREEWRVSLRSLPGRVSHGMAQQGQLPLRP